MTDPRVSPLPDDVRTLVEGARGVASAPSGARERVLARVESVLALPPGGGGGGGGGTAASSGTVPPSGTPFPYLKALAWVATFFVGAGLGVLATKAAMKPPEVRIVYVDRPIPATTTTPAVSTYGEVSAIPVDALPLAAQPRPATHPSGSAPPSAGSVSADTLAAERSLLDAARGAIERGDGQAALDLVAQHERRFPNGVLAQEREAMAIRALMLVGRTAEARDRFRQFQARFPGSVLLQPLQTAVGAPSAQ